MGVAKRALAKKATRKRTTAKKVPAPSVKRKIVFMFDTKVKVYTHELDDGTIVATRATVDIGSVNIDDFIHLELGVDGQLVEPADVNELDLLDRLLFQEGTTPPLQWEGTTLHPDFQ